MTYTRLGSKSKAFHRQGQMWHYTSGLPSDVTVEIGEMSFNLHKFPLISRSGLLEKLIEERTFTDGDTCILRLNQLPGGTKAFELVSKFCYGVKIELNSMNVVSLRCASEYLQMTEEYGDGNLISQTETFLNEVLGDWMDTIKALETCDEVLQQAEELRIVSRCINSLSSKACCSDSKIVQWPLLGGCNHEETGGARTSSSTFWNGICTTTTQPLNDDWWYEDVSFLSLHLYKRLIQAVEAAGMKPESIAGALIFYANKYLPQMNRQSSNKNMSSGPTEADQGALLEEIVELLPHQKGVVSTKFLLRLLRTAIVLQTGPCCRDNLERRVGLQLHEASLPDLLMPNVGCSSGTLYDTDCFQRILEHFVSAEHHASAASSPSTVQENQSNGEEVLCLSSITTVANLADAYLAEVAQDVNLEPTKFQRLAAAVPEYARLVFDGVYRAVDVYLKAHSWLKDEEREQICRLMNCHKLSLQASTHAAQNERLPLRVIVQVLFFEQLRLHTSISGSFFDSDNLESSQSPNSAPLLFKNGRERGTTRADDMKQRVSELEKECESMREEFRKLVKGKRTWNIFCSSRRSHLRNSKQSSVHKVKQLTCSIGNKF